MRADTPHILSKLEPSFMGAGGAASMEINGITAIAGHKPLFTQLSLTISAPELIWITGANGTGKTTLLGICAGIARPDAGRISWQIGGVDALPAQLISYLPPQGFAKSGLTLAEDFAFWNAINPAAPNDTAALELAQIAKHKTTPTQNLSTGQKRRLGLARLIADQKPIWILDEPMAGLDAQGRAFFIDLIKAHIARGGMAIIASHTPAAIDGLKARKLTLTAQDEDIV